MSGRFKFSPAWFGSLFFVVLLTFPSTGAAQKCTRILTGDWTLRQTNGIKVRLSLTQKGQNVSGNASFQDVKQGRNHTETGDVTGKFFFSSGKVWRMEIEIWWDYGETGVYKGNVDEASGVLSGYQSILQAAGHTSRDSSWKIMQEIPCR